MVSIFSFYFLYIFLRLFCTNKMLQAAAGQGGGLHGVGRGLRTGRGPTWHGKGVKDREGTHMAWRWGIGQGGGLHGVERGYWTGRGPTWRGMGV